MKTSYMVTPQNPTPNQSHHLHSNPSDAIAAEKQIIKETYKSAIITELKFIDDEVVSNRVVTFDIVAKAVNPAMGTIKNGERFNIIGLDTPYQLMDSGEAYAFNNGVEHNRLICRNVDGNLTDGEASKITQTFSNGDYFDYKGKQYMVLVVTANELHDTIVRFISI